MSARIRLRTAARLILILGIALGSTGCARLFSSYDVAPNGMPRRDDDLRRLLVSGQADSALARVEPNGSSAPEDELLRSLYSGILAHYDGSYRASSASLQEAADLAEDRYTKRVSRAALSLVTNDKVLPYDPGEAERLLIHYYGALNFIGRNDTEGAAVEARRLSTLLGRIDLPRDRVLAGWLHYFSGAVFEAAREWNDAAVSYRNARALLGSALVPDPEPGSRSSSAGTVLVVVEDGFVAHRVEQAVVVPLYRFELDRLSGGGTSERLAAASLVTARVLAEALSSHTRADRRYYSGRPRTIQVSPLSRDVALRECSAQRARERSGKEKSGSQEKSGSSPSCDLGSPYILRVAWPVFRQDPTPSRSVQVLATALGNGVKAATGSGGSDPLSSSTRSVPAEAARPSFRVRADLSNAVASEFESERSGILARTILRGVTKAAVTRRVERLPGEHGETVGKVLGVLMNLSTALLEQADTRSWQLLPDGLELIRLELPPGDHEVELEVSRGRSTRRIELGTVPVRAGELRIISTRIWN